MLNLSPHELLDLEKEIDLLYEIHSRRSLSDEGKKHWIRQLAPLYGKELKAVLTAARNEKTLPGLGSVMEAAGQMKARASRVLPTLQPLTIDEQERADVSRKKSGLWLAYFGEKVTGAMLAAFGLRDPEKLQAAKAEYDSQAIDAWMQVMTMREFEQAHKVPEPRASWQDLL